MSIFYISLAHLYVGNSFATYGRARPCVMFLFNDTYKEQKRFIKIDKLSFSKLISRFFYKLQSILFFGKSLFAGSNVFIPIP